MAKFIYYNNNPYNDTEQDCVCRAITLATGIPYRKVARDLIKSARLFGGDKLNLATYRHLLEDVYKLEPIKCKGMTVGEFADQHPYGTYLVRIPSHLTCVICERCFDIWNCLDEYATIAWRVD